MFSICREVVNDWLPYPSPHTGDRILLVRYHRRVRCDLYSNMKLRVETARNVPTLRDLNDGQAPLPRVYPDPTAPVLVNAEDSTREMRDVR